MSDPKMTDAISRSVAIEALNQHSYETSRDYDKTVELLNDLPALDVAPVVHEKDIRSSIITVNSVDEWQNRIILADDGTHVCAVYYADGDDCVPVVRCKDCKHWGMLEGPPETESVKCCEFGQYMVGANGYCVYGEVKEHD